MKSIKKFPIIVSLLSLVTLFAFAKQEKVIQIFRNGEVIQEYSVDDIDYIEVNDLIPAPSDVNASVTNDQITIKWNAVEGATYNIYRSPDNVNFILLASKLTETTYTDTIPLRGSNFYRVKAVVRDVESGYTSSAAATLTSSELDNGIYLGIIGFNQSLYEYPVLQLTKNSVDGFRNFVDGLTLKNGTLLYYSVDQALNAMQSAELPADISTAAIVTFTDGLDQGSFMMEGVSYDDEMDYLDALNRRIKNETVSGQPITAFSIGIRGKDVADINMFRANLAKLASSPDNATEVSNMSEVNDKFKEIAEKLSESNYVQTINLKMPGISNGSRVRFTFDNVNAANKSQIYIEGKFNLRDKSLEEVQYVGLTSTSGTTVKGKVDGIFVNFTFDGVHTDNNVLINSEFTDEWTYITSNNTWQINSEFDKAENSDIVTERSSAVIMLVLDCSSSLADDFAKVKTNANDFINILLENARNPYEVSGVILNTSEHNLQVGNTLKLVATVIPNTALLKDVTWTSSNTNIATVNQDGLVTGISPGKTIITVTTKDGKYSANCEIVVKYFAQNIYLNFESSTLKIGETLQLISSIYPNEVENKSVNWESSNNQIASVNNDGLVEALNAGEVTISASTTDGTKLIVTCNIKVVYSDYSQFAKMPIDLSLSVWKDNTRYYLTPKQYQYVDHTDIVTEGLVIIQNTEKFVLNLSDEDCEEVYAKAANGVYKNLLPTYSQAKIISAKWDAISSTLQEFGFSPLKSGTVGYGYTQGYISSTKETTTSDYYWIASPKNGEMITDGGYIHRVRTVKSLNENANSPILWHTEYDLKLLLRLPSGESIWCTPEEYITNIKDNPKYENWIKELRVDYNNSKFYMSVEDENCGVITAKSAHSLYSTNLPNYSEAQVMSVRWNAINTQLIKYGFSPLLTGTVGYGYTQGYISSSKPYTTSEYYYIASPRHGEAITDGGYSHRVRTVRR